MLAGIDGTPVSTRERALTTLTRQVAEPVDWAACMAGLAEEGCTVLLELGPGADLSRMVRDTLPSLSVRSVSEFKTLEGVCSVNARRAPWSRSLTTSAGHEGSLTAERQPPRRPVLSRHAASRSGASVRPGLLELVG
ncbi:hypothetical protein ACN28S_33785 [Cystobacter fuscus]